GSCKPLFDIELLDGFTIEAVSIARSVIVIGLAHGDAEAVEVFAGHEEKAQGGLMGLIRQDGAEADTGVVVDSDVQVFEPRTAGAPIQLPGDPAARTNDARQALYIEVNQVAGMLMLIALNRWRWLQRAQPIHPGSTQNAAHGGPAELQFAGNAPAVPALPAKSKNPF